jgi:CRISPR-associated endonuclease/helicase Cas3
VNIVDWAHSPNETGSPEPLLEHLERVATLAEGFAGRFNAGSWGRIVGLWHDVGKLAVNFRFTYAALANP